MKLTETKESKPVKDALFPLHTDYEYIVPNWSRVSKLERSYGQCIRVYEGYLAHCVEMSAISIEKQHFCCELPPCIQKPSYTHRGKIYAYTIIVPHTFFIY